MQKRVLILGKTGMLGHMVEHVLAADERFEVRGTELADEEHAYSFNVLDGMDKLHEIVARDGGYEYIINCIGITANQINGRESASVLRAIRINAAFPHELVAVAKEHGARVVLMSTDGVFSGAKDSPYTEDDAPDAADMYGHTKVLGEVCASNVLNIRTSIIGPSPFEHGGLWEWVAQQPEGATVQGYTNHIWHGVTTRQFAEFCARIITEDQFDIFRADGHLLHFAPNAPVTKAELVEGIAGAIGKRITVRPITRAQSMCRVLAMRSSIVEIFGSDHPITEALRACVVIPM